MYCKMALPYSNTKLSVTFTYSINENKPPISNILKYFKSMSNYMCLATWLNLGIHFIPF